MEKPKKTSEKRKMHYRDESKKIERAEQKNLLQNVKKNGVGMSRAHNIPISRQTCYTVTIE